MFVPVNRKHAFFFFLVFLLFMPATRISAAEGFQEIGTAKMKPVGSAAMTPIYGSCIPDGDYEIKVESSSSFFKVEKAVLSVKDGEMTALMYMYSSSYSHLYPGTAEEAAAQPSEDSYLTSETIDYYCTFTFPVEALNKPLDCASFSKRKQKWYSRQLVFLAASLPEGTLPFEVPDFNRINLALEEYDLTHPEEERSEEELQEIPLESSPVDFPDGEYSIEVSLAGGSGRASVTSPTWFYVREGEAYAKLLWSSSYYDYMILDGHRFYNETTDGSNSTFTIPITAMDSPMTVIADTTAMGDPLEIEYTLTFYESTIGSKSKVPQEGAKKVVLIALIFMIAGGIINHKVKKKNAPKKRKR